MSVRHCCWHQRLTQQRRIRAQRSNLAVSCLAGSIAEYLAGLTPRIRYDSGDLSKALKEVSPSRIPAAESAAIRLLVNCWPAVRSIAMELVAHGELSGDEVRL